MIHIEYYGPFKEHIKSHIELKQSVGYKYFVEAVHLKRFDTFTLEKYSFATTLTKEIVLDWCRKKPYEAQANQSTRASIIRQFSRYLDLIGVGAYIMPNGYYPKERQYVPHIYTDEELKRFFAETEKCHFCYECPYRQLIMPHRLSQGIPSKGRNPNASTNCPVLQGYQGQEIGESALKSLLDKGMLEPYVEKSTRTVLRRERGSNPSDLAGKSYPDCQ